MVHQRLLAALDPIAKGVPLKAVAPALGYGGAACLSRAFKKEFGIGPQQYVKTYTDIGAKVKEVSSLPVAFGKLMSQYGKNDPLTRLKNKTKQRHTKTAHSHPEETAGMTAPAINKLTKRENEIMRLLCNGLLNKEIGAKLNLSIATVSWHLERIYQKLAARNRTEAVYLYNKLLMANLASHNLSDTPLV